MTALAGVAVAIALAAWGLWWALRGRARRIETSRLARDEKVFRLRRLLLVGIGAMLPLYGSMLGIFAAIGHAKRGHGNTAAWVVALIAFLAVAVAVFAMSRTVRPSSPSDSLAG